MFSKDRDRAKELERLLEGLRSESDRETPDRESVSQEDEELQMLASLAAEVERGLMVLGPSDAFRRASRARVVRAMRARWAGRDRRRAPSLGRRRFPRISYVLASLALAVALATSGVGVAHAAENALPGDALYGVKQGIEKGRLFFTFSAQGDIRLLSEFATERLSEVERLITLGKGDLIGSTVLEYERLLDGITALARQVDMQDDAQALVKVETDLHQHMDVLEDVLGHVPGDTRPAIVNAMERSSHSMQVLEMLRDGGSPSDLAPGLLKKTQEALDAEATLEAGSEETPNGPPESPPGQSKDKNKNKGKDGSPNSSNPGQGRAGDREPGPPDWVGRDK